MKKFLLSFMTMLAIAGTSKAQNTMSVADIDLPQNSVATLTVSFTLDAADTYTGYSFDLELPSDLEFEMAEGTDVACTKGECHDATHSVTANLSEGLVKVAGLSLSSKPLKGTSGVLLTFTIKPKSPSLTIGQSYQGTIKNILLVPIEGSKQNLAASNFTVTIAEPADLRTVLDETSTVAPAAANGVDVRVKRTISAGNWNTICLPFAMDATQVKAAFGDDVMLGDFTSWSSEEDAGGDIVGINVGFTSVNSIEAHRPYIIKVSTPKTEFTVDGVNISENDEPYVQVGTKKAERGFFTGTYVANFSVPKDNLFLNGGQFWYSKGKTKMKAFRGYFEFYDVLTDVENASRISISFDNATGINDIRTNTETGDNYYDLQGRKVVNPKNGLYIHNNKKVIIK